MERLHKHLPTLAEAKFQTAAIAAMGVGYMGSYIATVINPALLVETSLGAPAVGMLGSIELFLLALFSLVLAPFVPRFSYRGLAIAGAACVAFGYFVSALTEAFVPMAIARVIMGIGEGIAIVAANAAIASSDDPDRRFAMVYAIGAVLAAVFIIAVPLFIVRWGYQGAFVTCGLMCLLVLPFCAWLPRHAEDTPQSVTREPQPLPPESPPSALAVGLVIVAIGIYSIGEQALWAFAGEITIRNVGIEMREIGPIFGLLSLAGATGGVVAWKLGTRWGRALPVLVGSLLSSLSRFGFMLASDYNLMISAGLLWVLSFYFISPYQMGVAAAMDRTGRVAVAGGAFMNFGYAFGPGIGGAVIGYLGQQSLLPVVVACVVIPLAMMLPVAFAQDRVARLLLRETAPKQSSEVGSTRLDEVADAD